MTTRALIGAIAGGATFASVGVLAHAESLALTRLAVLGAALVSAAFFDFAQRRIPNRIVLPAAAACAALTLQPAHRSRSSRASRRSSSS